MKKEIIEERRTRFLENLLQEAIVNILAEQAAAAPAPEAPAPEAPATAAPAEEATTAEEGNTEFTIEEMIERLNVIRGGKSFKDNDVYTKLIVFFSKLSDQQKNDLRQMLIDIGQAVINVPEEGKAETAPAETPVEAPAVETPPVAPPAPAAPAPAPAVPPAPAV
jgi:pyruvate dehydrogenase E2 component (dihydrolipoamide acetyltransferase)